MTATAMAPPPILERCEQLLLRWRGQLSLSARERTSLGPELAALDRQLERLRRREAHVAVLGRVGVGKSSLLNALLGEPRFATDLAHGSTRAQQRQLWSGAMDGPLQVQLVDTPGIDEVAAAARHRLAARVALGADLVLVVLDGDLSRVEADAVQLLLSSGKPLLLVVNRIDGWPEGSEKPCWPASAAGFPLPPVSWSWSPLPRRPGAVCCSPMAGCAASSCRRRWSPCA